MLLSDLPDVVLEMILTNLSYDEIAQNRLVCTRFDITCQKLLNRGFCLVEKYHASCLRGVKSKLPRRESERRNHPLARHCDALTAIETRISMLSMTFMKYINMDRCCFIPGKVIDEIFRVLHLIRNSKSPPRTHEILQELRDISSMAMEHFEEKILPGLKSNMSSSSTSRGSSFDIASGSLMMPHTQPPTVISNLFFTGQGVSPERLGKAFVKMYTRAKRNKASFQTVKCRIGKMRLRLKRQGFQMRVQSSKIQQQAKKLQDQEIQISEMKRHLEDWEQKIGDLTAELSRSRDESQKSEGIEGCKRKCIELTSPRGVDAEKSKELQAKKRKLIVERQSSTDAKDVAFKKFMSDLLCKNSMEYECTSTSSS